MKKRMARTIQTLVQEAFGLVLELRSHHEPQRVLSQAVAFLHMLARGRDTDAAAVMVSVRVMRLRDS